jgi:hypothetical protein
MSFNKRFTFYTLGILLTASITGFAQSEKIVHDVKAKQVVFGNDKIKLTLDYNKTANISQLTANGQLVLQGMTGIYSAIRTKDKMYSTSRLEADPAIRISGNKVIADNIVYGDKEVAIRETWTFTVTSRDIRFNISRNMSKTIVAEKMGSPVFAFTDMKTWEGAYQNYGGLAWFYLFNKRRDTYGVYSNLSDFWNSKTGIGLTVAVASRGKQVMMDYSRGTDDKLLYTIGTSATKVLPRFDGDTRRRLYVRDTTDVWSPVTIPAGKSEQSLTLSYFDFAQKYGRGKLVGINQEQVSAVLNTIARIGVIGKKHFGGNSWHTPYGPICLHEQYIAQMGLGINDPKYVAGYQECLDYYRENALKPDGRVWPRWAYSNEDAMPNAFTNNGFYEAQWGYLLDSNPDYVINVAELYDQNGNIQWVKTHQQACEKALDWILSRDSNHNGLVEMMTDNHQQKRGSDWIDIIWASYENAFVNAKLYHALVLWAAIEKQLGNTKKESQYKACAEKLKSSFNKPATTGGFWDEDKRCYIHWRDKDGSIHGNNMVTPVNFMAIAYGICDEKTRANTILENIEVQMQKENLFFWPICLYSYAPGEGNDWQFPFPNYENGDIFLSWGSVAVKAYASYKPELALKYIRNVLDRYALDGLAFQRYGRAKQDGLGDDILSGNSLSVVGLYQAIYGINPKYNRFYLAPHITNDLAGTQVRYNYRGQLLIIDLEVNRYAVSDNRFKISCTNDFGFNSHDKELQFFTNNADQASLTAKVSSNEPFAINIVKWDNEEMIYTQTYGGPTQKKIVYQINQLKPGTTYLITVNKSNYRRIKTNSNGQLVFEQNGSKNQCEIIVSLNQAGQKMAISP